MQVFEVGVEAITISSHHAYDDIMHMMIIYRKRGDRMSWLSGIDSNELILITVLAAFVIADDLSADELNSLGNAIVAAGSLILTKAAQEAFLLVK